MSDWIQRYNASWHDRTPNVYLLLCRSFYVFLEIVTFFSEALVGKSYIEKKKEKLN